MFRAAPHFHAQAIRLALLLIGTVGVTGCISSPFKVLAPDSEGRARYEITVPAANEPPVVDGYKNDRWKIELTLPAGWKYEGETTKPELPGKLQFTRPNAWLTVYCWEGVSEVAALKQKMAERFAGVDAPPEIKGAVWVIPGAGQPAEMYTYFGYHDALFEIPDPADKAKVLKYVLRYQKTFKVIVKPASAPGRCNYGVELLEVTDGKVPTETMAGSAIAIGRSLK